MLKGDEDWAVPRCGHCGEKHLILTEEECVEASRQRNLRFLQDPDSFPLPFGGERGCRDNT